MVAVLPGEERRRRQRRLADLLEALVQLHLADDRRPDVGLLAQLAEVGIRGPDQLEVPLLIKRVAAIQTLYLGRLEPERRYFVRRKADIPAGAFAIK